MEPIGTHGGFRANYLLGPPSFSKFEAQSTVVGRVSRASHGRVFFLCCRVVLFFVWCGRGLLQKCVAYFLLGRGKTS